MIDTKHTPGPWTAERHEHGWHVGPQPSGVCTIHDNTNGSRYAEHQANAALIAAAPDLLAACMAGRAIAERSVCPFGRPYAPREDCDCNYHASYRAMLAAIAKAAQEPT